MIKIIFEHKSGMNHGIPIYSISAIDSNNNVIGHAEFEQVGNYWEPQNVNVLIQYRRTGIATEIYNELQNKTGQKIVRSQSQTSDGKKFRF